MSKVNDDGGQAFPCAGYDGLDRGEDGVQGMTLLDYFAAKALPAFIKGYPPPETAAKMAYQYAQACMAERSRREAQP